MIARLLQWWNPRRYFAGSARGRDLELLAEHLFGVTRRVHVPRWWPWIWFPRVWPFVESDRALRARTADQLTTWNPRP